jgi:DNA-binding SARP family transcriptional activator
MGLIASKLVPPPAEGLRRERLLDALTGIRRVALVIAPAGSGKTTLLGQLTRRISADPVAWYRAEREDRAREDFLQHLEYTLNTALPTLDTGWNDVNAAATALARWAGHPARESGGAGRATIVIDDFHALHGSDAEAAFGRLLDYLPEGIRVVIASRIEPGPGINLSRLWVSGHVVEVDADDLRFRSWEVERLFHEIYSEPLPPEDLAALTRRTNGWAAGLKLFHLASTGKPAADRRRMVAELTVRSRMVREYLATNIVADLPTALRSFLRDTCVLTRLNARLCDELRGEHDSAALLTELARRQLLTQTDGDGDWYRCHDVLRSYVQAVLIEEVGEQQARARYRRAGNLLERAGHLGDAAVAFCYAESWDAAYRVLSEASGELGPSDLQWPDTLPTAPDDPWFHLIVARRAVAEGRLNKADIAYRRAERATGPALVTDIARREHRTLASWLDPRSQAPREWVAALQAATRGVPESQRPPVTDPNERRLVTGVSCLLVGDLHGATTALTDVADEVSGRRGLTSVARLTAALAALFDGDTMAAATIEQASDYCDKQGMAWLAHLGRAAMSMARTDAVDEARAVRERCLRFEDRIGAALAALFGGLAAVGDESASALLTEAATTFRQLELRALEMWALAGRALALEAIGSPDAQTAAIGATALGRYTGAQRVLPMLRQFLAASEPVAPSVTAAPVTSAVAEPVASSVTAAHVTARDSHATDQTVTLRLLGGFALHVGDRRLDMTQMKPRARAVLHVLALHAGRPVHRDVVVEALWPDRDPQAALRAMHVALSAIRRQLEALAPMHGAPLLGRHGDTYALASDPAVWIDVVHFERTRNAGRRAARANDVETATDHYREALSIYRGDLLPEAGAVEWILTRREELRVAAADIAEHLATLLLEQDDLVGAVSVCERGLSIDGFRDGLWRLAATAHERRGHHAAAERVRQSYEQVLRDLGVPTSD